MSLAWFRNMFGVDYTVIDTDTNNQYHDGFLPNRFYAMSGTVGTGVVPTGVINYSPITISRLTSIDRLACNVTVGLAGSVNLGIYTSTTGFADRLIATGASQDTTAAGNKVVTFPTITLPPNVYWLASTFNAACTASVESNNNNNALFCGAPVYPLNVNGYFQTFAFAPLPLVTDKVTINTAFGVPRIAWGVSIV